MVIILEKVGEKENGYFNIGIYIYTPLFWKIINNSYYSSKLFVILNRNR